MARILTRPLFRKGGLSQAPRPSYQGGGVMAIRPGYRGGGMNGIMSGIVDRQPFKTGSWYKPWTWGGGQPYGDWLKSQITKIGQPPKAPLESRIASGAKNILKKGWGMFPREGIASIVARNFPKTTAAGAHVAPYALAGYGSLKQLELIDKAAEKGLLDEMDFEYVDGRVLPTEETVQKIRPYKSPQQIAKEEAMKPKENKIEKKINIDNQDLKKKSDIESIYGDLLPMIERELGADPDDTKRQLYVQLAQAGANLLAQPGGDLVGAIGKAVKEPISTVGKVLDKESATDREAKILAFKLAADRASPGEMGKLIQDLENANFSKQEINSIIQNRQPGSGYRANVKFEETKELRTELQDEFDKKIQKGKSVPLSTAKDLKFAQDNFGMSISDFKVLPKKEERVPGEYYFNPKDRTLGRLSKDGKTLIKPRETGFMDKTE